MLKPKKSALTQLPIVQHFEPSATTYVRTARTQRGPKKTPLIPLWLLQRSAPSETTFVRPGDTTRARRQNYLVQPIDLAIATPLKTNPYQPPLPQLPRAASAKRTGSAW